MLEVTDLTVAYGGVIALENVSLSVPRAASPPAGGERRRQDDAGENHLRPHQAASWLGDARHPAADRPVA